MSRRSRPAVWTVATVVAATCFFTAAPVLGTESSWDPNEGYSVPTFTAEAINRDGTLDTQAGSHPYEAVTNFTFAGADTKDIEVDLPAGFLGNPQATPKCPLNQLTNPLNACPADTQVGTVQTSIDPAGITPVYNLVPEPGKPAEFGFTQLGFAIPVILYGSVRNGGDYGIDVTTPPIAQGRQLTFVHFVFWGVPADPSHDAQRMEPLSCSVPNFEGFPGCRRGASSGAALTPFLTNPVDCATGPLSVALKVDSWQYPGHLVTKETAVPPVSGCDKLTFEPSIAVTPDTTQVDTPTGLTIDIKVPQTNAPNQLATPELRNTTLTFPPGMAISPSAADGLAGCTDAQFAVNSGDPAACPNASQVATVQITTPLLAERLPGQLYLGSPLCSPCSSADTSSGRVFRVFLQAQTQGALIKLAGTVSADPVSGQLTATFDNAPQLPFSDLTIHVKGGSRAAFVNPATCGTQATTSDLTPWSGGPGGSTPDANPSSSFDVDWDGSGGVCPPGPQPFVPSFSAGTEVPLANGFSPFTLTFSRPDGNQPLSAFSMQLPPGLLAMISSVPLCPEPQASQGTCSSDSQIGTTTVGAGSGPHPFFLGGNVYLTGPYKGAPFGFSAVVPVVAGPYNLGKVVVRGAINVDQHDAHAIITTDPLPQILSGVPTRLRTVSVTLDRPGFMFNPSNCSPQRITATLGGGEGAGAQVSSPFDVGGCQGLPFKPKFSASTSGHTSRANGASLDAKISIGIAGEANVRSVKVDLPKQLPSRLTTLQKACPSATFTANPALCPRGSIVGIAKAITPLLAGTLTGPAIFVSHGGEAFPDLEIVLQGEGVRVDLQGSTFISKAGITSSTFKAVPDVPVDSFELYLPQGPSSALAANGNLCRSKLRMPTRIVAQNGAVIVQSTKINVTGCPKATAARKAHAARKASYRRTGHRRSHQ
jgi:hypothetical protein